MMYLTETTGTSDPQVWIVKHITTSNAGQTTSTTATVDEYPELIDAEIRNRSWFDDVYDSFAETSKSFWAFTDVCRGLPKTPSWEGHVRGHLPPRYFDRFQHRFKGLVYRPIRQPGAYRDVRRRHRQRRLASLRA